MTNSPSAAAAAQHPLTPPPELLQRWADEHFRNSGWIDAAGDTSGVRRAIATQAARWGADQELEACCEWAAEQDRGFDIELRAVRRPKPPSLKEQALAALNRYEAEVWCEEMTSDSNIIRRALEALPE